MTHNNPKLSDELLRDNSGRFTKGSSGRPKGAKGKFNRYALEAVKSYGPVAIEKLYQAVTANERWAIEFILSKILPSGRTIEFEDLTSEDIISALNAGNITLTEAKDATTITTKLAELDDIQLIKNKIFVLEQAMNDKR